MCSNPNSTPTHQPHEHLVCYKLWQVFPHQQSESKSHYYPHFTDKETETQRREVSCPGCTCPVMTDLIPTQFSLYRTQVSYISPFPTKCHGAKETWVLNWELLRSVSQLSHLPWYKMLVAHQNPSFLSSIVTELLVNTCLTATSHISQPLLQPSVVTWINPRHENLQIFVVLASLLSSSRELGMAQLPLHRQRAKTKRKQTWTLSCHHASWGWDQVRQRNKKEAIWVYMTGWN